MSRELNLKPRFIPTPVGNTPPNADHKDMAPVHPHACGEHKTAIPSKSREDGSSPRLWGTLGSGEIAYPHISVHPHACGEHGIAERRNPVEPAVHPHACGEHWFGESIGSYGAGSSPRLWGTLHRADSDNTSFRFIPTPVGNTSPVRF